MRDEMSIRAGKRRHMLCEKREKNKMKHFAMASFCRKAVSLIMAVIMVVSILPVNSKAASANNTKLVDTTISLSLFPVHYIVYDYVGTRLDSRYATQSGNYNAWEKMNDSDKAKVTKWYAGFYSQMERQFGYNAAKDMLDWANQHNGWADAGSKLRDRLAQKSYPELYEFYGDPDSPNSILDEVYAYRNQVNELAVYSRKEQEELEVKIDDYHTAYVEGLDAYQKLMKLKQAQTNVAVTAISSDLVQIIVDNMVVSSPLSLPSSLDDIKDAAVDFMDQALEISDTLKQTSIYKYTVYGVRDGLTGADKRIDSKEAAKVIVVYNKLLAAREDYAQAGYLTCKQMKEDLDKELNIVKANDDTRKTTAAEANAARAAAHKKALEEGVAYSDTVVPDTSSVDIEKYYGTDASGIRYLKQEEYNKARLNAAISWAEDKWESEYVDYENLLDNWVTEADDIKASVDEIRKGCVFSITKQSPDTIDGVAVDDSISYLFAHDYEGSVSATEKEYEKTINNLRSNLNDMNAKLNELTKSVTDLKTSIIPYQNYLYSLCYGASEEYGNWGLGDDKWSSATALLNSKISSCEVRFNSVEADIRYVSGFLDTLEYKYEHFETERKAFESSLKPVYELYEQTQRDIDYGMSQAIRFTNLLREKQDSYPDWLKYHTVYYRGAEYEMSFNANVKYERLYAELTKDCEFGSEQYRANVETKLHELEQYPDTEAYYLEMIALAHEVLDNAVILREVNKKFEYREHLGEQEIKNLNKMGLGGMTIKSYATMSEEFGYGDYENYSNASDKGYVHETYILDTLIRDLNGENKYMNSMRALYQEVLAKRGDWLRAAKVGSSDYMQEMKEYKSRATATQYVTPDDRVINGILPVADHMSYTSYLVQEYYEKNILPIFNEVEQVYNGKKVYVPVEGLNGGGSSKNGGSNDISDDNLNTPNAPESDNEAAIDGNKVDADKTTSDAGNYGDKENSTASDAGSNGDKENSTNSDVGNDKNNENSIASEANSNGGEENIYEEDSINKYNNAESADAPAVGEIVADKSGTAKYRVIGTDKEDETVNVGLVAYGNNKVTKLTVPKRVVLADGRKATVTSIADSAFAGNKKLTAVKIPATVKSIGKGAFKNCIKLEKVTIPKNVTTIGENAFAGDKKLKRVTIKSKTLKIDQGAFSNCSKLTRIIIKSTSISSIGKNAFKGIAGNAAVKVPKKQKKTYTKLLKKAGFKGKVK